MVQLSPGAPSCHCCWHLLQLPGHAPCLRAAQHHLWQQHRLVRNLGTLTTFWGGVIGSYARPCWSRPAGSFTQERIFTGSLASHAGKALGNQPCLIDAGKSKIRNPAMLKAGCRPCDSIFMRPSAHCSAIDTAIRQQRYVLWETSVKDIVWTQDQQIQDHADIHIREPGKS